MANLRFQVCFILVTSILLILPFSYPFSTNHQRLSLEGAIVSLSRNGSKKMAQAIRYISKSIVSSNNSLTIFTPKDEAFRHHAHEPSLSFLKYHMIPSTLTNKKLQEMTYGTKIKTLYSNHTLTITTNHSTVSINGVIIGNTIHKDGLITIFNINDHFFDPLFQVKEYDIDSNIVDSFRLEKNLEIKPKPSDPFIFDFDFDCASLKDIIRECGYEKTNFDIEVVGDVNGDIDGALLVEAFDSLSSLVIRGFYVLAFIATLLPLCKPLHFQLQMRKLTHEGVILALLMLHCLELLGDANVIRPAPTSTLHMWWRCYNFYLSALSTFFTLHSIMMSPASSILHMVADLVLWAYQFTHSMLAAQAGIMKLHVPHRADDLASYVTMVSLAYHAWNIGKLVVSVMRTAQVWHYFIHSSTHNHRE